MRISSFRNSIIAIHGIGTDPDGTWISNKEGANWLKDPGMLPGAAPQARIMRFGWESQWIGRDSIDQCCSLVADQILDSLRTERQVVFRDIHLDICRRGVYHVDQRGN